MRKVGILRDHVSLHRRLRGLARPSKPGEKKKRGIGNKHVLRLRFRLMSYFDVHPSYAGSLGVAMPPLVLQKKKKRPD
jgi:hypothetical protein